MALGSLQSSTMAHGRFRISVDADGFDDDAKRKIDRSMRDMDSRVQKAMSRMGETIKRAFAVGTAAGVAGFAVLAKSSLAAASDFDEAANKIDELFKGSADVVQRFAATSATSLGQSRNSVLDAAATFGIFGQSAGLAGDDLAKFSTDFVALSSDLASFHNTSPEDAITAIGAALRGETEPIRRYGVMLDDATMRHKALELGIISSTKQALLPNQKVLAAQALIYAKTKSAQGDFARTSGGLANQQRILTAQWENAKITLGTALLPLATKAFGYLNREAMPVVERMSTAFRDRWAPAIGRVIKQLTEGDIGKWFRELKTNVGPLDKLLHNVSDGAGKLAPLVRLLGDAVQFGARHIDKLIAALPILLGLLAAWKGLQAANNLLGRDSAIGLGLQVASNLALAQTNRSLAASMVAVTAAQTSANTATATGTVARNASLLTTIRQTAANGAHRLSTIATSVATKAMTAGQWLLNAAMTANPIGLVVAALVALVAGLVIAYKKSDTFRAIVDKAFAVVIDAAKGVIKWFGELAKSAVAMWHSHIKPTLDRIVAGFKTYLAPIIQLAVALIVGYFRMWWTGLKLLWDTVGKPILDAIIAAVGRMKDWVGQKLGDIKFAWSLLWAALTLGWDEHGQPLVDKFLAAWDRAKSGFSAFGDHVKGEWRGIKTSTASAINAFIHLINRGVIGNFNKLAGIFGTKTIPQIGLVGVQRSRGRSLIGGLQARADGGYITGWSPHHRADNILAKVTAGEFVLPVKATEALMRAVGPAGLELMRQGVLPNVTKGDPPLPAYADGGLVNRVPAVHQWMRAQRGKPYVWAASGPGGYDCSGAVSALINRIQGRYPYRRLFATGSLPGYFRPGKGLLTIGVDKPGEKHRIGHTAANFAGLNFESRGSRGVLVGPSARSPFSFNHQYTIPSVGGKFIDGGGGGFSLPNPLDWIRGHLGSLGDNMFAKMLASGAKKLAKLAVDKLNPFDSGGVAEGVGWMRKDIIDPERVLSPRETIAFERLVASLESGEVYTGPRNQPPQTVVHNHYDIHIDVHETDDAESTAEAVVAELGRRL